MADDDGLPDTPDTPDTPDAVDHDAANPAPHPAPATPPRSRRTGLIAGAIAVVVALVVVLVLVLGGDNDDQHLTGGATSPLAGSPGTGTGPTGSTAPLEPVLQLPDIAPLVSAPGAHFDFSPDSSRIAIAGWEQPTSVWELGSGTQAVTIDEPSSTVQYSGDGTILLTSRIEGDRLDPSVGPARTWDATTGQQLAGFDEANPQASTPQLTGRDQVVVMHDADVTVYDARDGSAGTVFPFTGSPEGVFASPGGGTLVVSSLGTTYVIDTKSGKVQFQFTDPGTCRVSAAGFDPKSRRIVGVDGCTGSYVVWDALNGTELAHIADPGRTGGRPVFSADGSLIIACGVSATEATACDLWDAATGAARGSLGRSAGLPASFLVPSTLVTADVSSDGTHLAVSFDRNTGEPGWTTVYNLATSAIEHEAPALSSAAFSPDSTRLAGVHRISFEQEEVVVYALVEVPEQAPAGDGTGDGGSTGGTTAGGSTPVTAPPGETTEWRPAGVFLTTSPDGALMAVQDQASRTITVWDTASRRQVQQLRGDYAEVSFAADNSLLLATSTDRILASPYHVDVIAIPSGTVLGSHQMPAATNPPVYSLAAAALVLPTNTGGFEVRRVDGTTVRSIGTGSHPQRWRLSTDGAVLAVATTSTVTLYDDTTGAVRSTIATACPSVDRLDLARRGDFLVVDESCGGTFSVRVYDTATGGLVSAPAAPGSVYASFAFSNDGSVLIIGTDEQHPLQVFDRSGQLLSELAPPAELQSLISTLDASIIRINSVVLSADHRLAAVVYGLFHGPGGYEFSAYTEVFEVQSGQPLGPMQPIDATAFDPRNTVIAGRTTRAAAVVFSL